MRLLSLLAGVLLLFGLAGPGDSPAQQPPPPSMAWNRFETQNFEFLATNKADGEQLYKSMEYMRRWIYDRWGLKQCDFSVKCKLLVVQDQATYKKLFEKDRPIVKVEREPDGNTKSLTIWCWVEARWYTSTLPALMTEVCIAEFEQQHKVKLPYWAARGMVCLNRSIPEIRADVGSLSHIYAQNLPCFWTDDILTMTPEKLAKYQPQNQQWFDRECQAFCLYLIKTHGRKKFLDFLDASMKNPQTAPPTVGFATYADADKAFNRYMYNLSADIVGNRTPNAYLTWDSN
jgi:hypothetical protein